MRLTLFCLALKCLALKRPTLKISDKNKSLEKEMKQSYSEALSGWSQDEITDDHQHKSKKPDSERKDRRYCHKVVFVFITVPLSHL